MRYLLLLVSAFGLAAQDSPLPGPIGALPDGAGAPTKICSYDAALGHCSGIVSDASTTGNWVITAKNTGYAFDNFVNPAGDLSESLGTCATSATCPSGTGAKEWLSLHIQNLYNYGPNPMSIYSDTQSMVLDTHANQPIQVYTNNTHRWDFLGNGDVELYGGNFLFSNNSTQIGSAANQALFIDAQNHYGLDPGNTANYCRFGYTGIFCTQGATQELSIDGTNGNITSAAMAGSGTRCVQVSSTGLYSPFSSGCGGTGTTNTNLYQQCGGTLTLTGSYQNACGGITITTTGTWLINGSMELIVFTPTVAGLMYVNTNGTPQTSYAFGTVAQFNAQSTEGIGSTVSQTWVLSMTAGDTLNLSVIQGGSGTSTSNGGSLSATFLHP